MNVYLILGILFICYLGFEYSNVEAMSIIPPQSFLKAEMVAPTNELPYSRGVGDFGNALEGVPYHINYLPRTSCKQNPSLFPYYTWDGE